MSKVTLCKSRTVNVIIRRGFLRSSQGKKSCKAMCRARRAMEPSPRLTPNQKALCSLWGFGNWPLSRSGKGANPNVFICMQGKEVTGLRGEKKIG